MELPKCWLKSWIVASEIMSWIAGTTCSQIPTRWTFNDLCLLSWTETWILSRWSVIHGRTRHLSMMSWKWSWMRLSFRYGHDSISIQSLLATVKAFSGISPSSHTWLMLNFSYPCWIDRGERSHDQKEVRYWRQRLFLEQECISSFPSGRRGNWQWTDKVQEGCCSDLADEWRQ